MPAIAAAHIPSQRVCIPIRKTFIIFLRASRPASSCDSICHMKRTTIFVPESLERDLQLYAAREGKSTASVVREALAEYVAKRRVAGALPSFTGAFASGHTDTAERHEELLFKKAASGRGPKRSAPRRGR